MAHQTKRASKNTRPILRGFVFTSRHGTKLIAVHCPHCDRFHDHAAPVNGPEHRQAHCGGSSGPFHERGYWIAPFRKTDLSDIGVTP